MGNDGFRVDLGALQQASQGVNDAIAALEDELPWPVKKLGNDGQGVAMMTLNAEESGSALVAEALRMFCGKWNYGVKFLVEEGAAAAAALTDTRTEYEKMEQGVIDAFKKIMGAGFDNPTADLNAAPQKSLAQFGVDIAPEGLTQQGVSQAFNQRGWNTRVES
ncbi:hypothetical protein [Saccharopolyspora hattusasensis]|uniref:hypothetical protein n=1 Tax=Saccharopolyspora hattusasensis TaxID=1128679 RepID=UPI003D96C177